jgi:hypothetical protein
MRRTCRRVLLALAAAALTANGLSCAFDPAVRRSEPERVGDADVDLVRTLDRSGAFVLVSARGGKTRSVWHWRRGTRCQVPAGFPHLLRALHGPTSASGDARQLVLPMVAEGKAAEDSALSAVDERCVSLGTLGALRRDSVKTRTSARDGRDVLYAQTASADLVVLDPFRRPGLQTLAKSVDAFWPTALDDGSDAVWVLAGGRLALLTLEGSVERVLGEAVAEAVLESRSGRIAYVDAGELVVADPPSFKARALASEACTPRFAGLDLYAFAPCAERRLLTLYNKAEAVTRYPADVLAARKQGELEVVYREVDGAPSMTLQRGRARAQELAPPLRPEATYVLDDGRLIGLTADDVLGVHDAAHGSFRVLFEQVSDLRAAYRGKTRSYWFLAYHHLTDGLGTLSGVASGDLSRWTLADGVPPADAGGYRLDTGAAFASGTFPEPVLVALSDVPAGSEDAEPLGTLRAALVSGKPAAELADHVDAYLLVAAPLPGLLYRVPRGEGAGVWYVPL